MDLIHRLETRAEQAECPGDTCKFPGMGVALETALVHAACSAPALPATHEGASSIEKTIEILGTQRTALPPDASTKRSFF